MNEQVRKRKERIHEYKELTLRPLYHKTRNLSSKNKKIYIISFVGVQFNMFCVSKKHQSIKNGFIENGFIKILVLIKICTFKFKNKKV